jgi:hypothetical protein
LLAVGASGALWALSATGTAATALAEGLDPLTPLASGTAASLRATPTVACGCGKAARGGAVRSKAKIERSLRGHCAATTREILRFL